MSTRRQAEVFPGRNFYRGKGVDWIRFLPWLLAAMIVAAILAEGMAELFRLGHYYIFIVPILAAVCVAGMITLAVRKGHCRNAMMGALAGFGAGVVLYLGYFYFGMIHDAGPEIAAHPESLPDYIRFRMAVEVTHDIHEPDRDEKPKAPGEAGVYMNWGRFAFEFVVVLAITTGAGLKGSRKPYCETCRRWTERELTQFDPNQSTELVEALRTHSARSLAALCARAPFITIPNVSLAVDLCPALKDGQSRDCPVYVSVKSITAIPKKAIRDVFEQSKGKMLVQGMQLNPDELAALAPRFKIFETVAGRSAVSALLPEDKPDETVADQSRAYAEITPLGSDHAEKIMTRKTVLMGNALALIGPVAFLAGITFLLCGGLTAFPDHPPAEGVAPATRDLGVGLMTLGAILFCVTIVLIFMGSNSLSSRYVRKVLRQELDRRSSLMVDPNDPEALVVEIVPKLNWGKMMLENASDVGLMLVDRSRREIRFEGDKERWRIPAAAITHCAVEEFVLRQGEGRTKRYYVVLRANHRSGFWEAPIRARGRSGSLPRNQKKAAAQIRELIQGIQGVG
jgi:hypothetical protein